MNNFYHKIAAALVCTALSFVLEANEEAKAASFNLAPAITFEVIDGGVGFEDSFDGRGDQIFPGNFSIALKGITGDAGQFAEFNIGSLSLVPGTIINSAVFQAEIGSFDVFGLGIGYINPGSLGIFGYVGNGIPDKSDFEAGVFLNSVDVSSSSVGDILSFDVTSFVNQRASNSDTFAGFGIRALNIGGVGLAGGVNSTTPRLIVETAESVPEPTNIFGSALALSVGGWLKRKKSDQQNKTMPHH
jgi:hypothetical protein